MARPTVGLKVVLLGIQLAVQLAELLVHSKVVPMVEWKEQNLVGQMGKRSAA